MSPSPAVAPQLEVHAPAKFASPWSLAGSTVVVEFEVRALWGTKSTLISSLILEPILYMALLVAGLQGIISSAGGTSASNYVTFVFPGLLALQTIQGFSRAMYRCTAERRWGLLALKRLAGVGPLGYVLAMTVTFIAAFLIQSIVATPIALLLGLQATLVGWLAAVVLGSVLLLFWSGLAIVMTAVIRNYQQRDTIIGLLMLPLTFSAPVFFSLETAPRYLQIVAQFNPLTYQVMAMRNALTGRVDPTILAISLGFSVLAVAAAVISISRGELLGPEV